MTRVVRFHEFGGPEVLRIEKIDIAAPGPNEIRILVKALGLNRAEAMLRAGHYLEAPKFPSGLGYEASGLIESLGPGVKGFALGDAVSIIPPLSMIQWPAYGELATFPAEVVVKHPASLSWEGAAALWMQYVTAYGALIDVAKLGSGDFVIITAASSSVGIAAIQIANMVGAIPIATTRTSAKAKALTEIGAAHVVATEEENLELRVTEIAGPGGVRVVFDPVGGPSFHPLTAVMSRGGILVEYGALSSEPTPFPLFTVLSKSLSLRGFLYSEIVADVERLDAAKRFILNGLATGALTPVIAKIFPFEQIVDAHRYLESNQQFGKIVVTI
jgi:NADPH:quinone reductase-like Zn-dependent oxidoreductase